MAIGVRHAAQCRTGGQVGSAWLPVYFQDVVLFKAYCFVVGRSGLNVGGIIRSFGIGRFITCGGVCLLVGARAVVYWRSVSELRAIAAAVVRTFPLILRRLPVVFRACGLRAIATVVRWALPVVLRGLPVVFRACGLRTIAAVVWWALPVVLRGLPVVFRACGLRTIVAVVRRALPVVSRARGLWAIPCVFRASRLRSLPMVARA